MTPAPTARTGRSAWRIAGSTLDQAISSVTNVLLSVSVARGATPELYGRVAVAITVVIALLTVTRLSVGAYLVSLAGSSAEERAAGTGSAMCLQALIAPAAALGPLVLVGSGSGQYLGVLVALAVIGPVVVLQDGLRYVATSEGRPWIALASDLAWLALFLVGWGLTSGNREPALTLVVTWGIGAALGLVIAFWGTRCRPASRHFPTWWRASRPAMVPLLGDGVITALTPLGTVAIISVVLPFDQTAGFLGVATVFGPVNVALVLFSFLVSAELERANDERRIRRVLGGIALVTSIAVAAYTAGLLQLPDAWGRQLLGASWSLAQPAIMYRGIEMAALGMLVLVHVHWRRFRWYTLQLSSKLALAVATLLVVAVAGSLTGTAAGVALASAAAACLITTVSAFLTPRVRRPSGGWAP